MAARWLAISVLTACAGVSAAPSIPPAPTLDAPVRDYRAVTRPDVRFAVDTAPLSVIVADTADGDSFTMATVARRVGRTVLTVRSDPGSRVRELRFYDDSGRIVRRVLDTALFPVPVTRIVRGNNGAFILPGPFGRWKTFDSAGRAIAADSVVRIGVQGEWIGMLADGSSILHSFEPSPVHVPSGETVVVRSASYIRLDPRDRPQYLAIFSRDPMVMAMMPASLSNQVIGSPNGTTLVVPPNAMMGPPRIASWPVRPSIPALVSDSTIWDFDVLIWRIVAYDGSGRARAVIRPPIPPANDSAQVRHPVPLASAWTLQTLLDDSGRLWMEPFDTPRPGGGNRPAGIPALIPRATASRLWAFAPDGTLLGAMEVPAGLRVLQIGPDFVFGLERRGGTVAAVTYRVR